MYTILGLPKKKKKMTIFQVTQDEKFFNTGKSHPDELASRGS
jgi:hypothetical protein